MSSDDEQTTPEAAEGGIAPTGEAADEALPGGERALSGRQVLLGGLAAAALLSLGGIAAWLTVGTPGPDVLTARVERRVLDGSVAVRGTVSAGQTVELQPLLDGNAGMVRAVVTKLPVRPGDTVAAGRMLLEVSGRPVFALPGDLPAYRDLKPGSRGQDVTQLQKALRGLGYRISGDAGTDFGPGTAAALKAFYTERGYQPLPAHPDGDVRVAMAEDVVTAVRRARQDATDALEAAREQLGLATPGQDVAAIAQQAVRTAQQRVTRAAADLTAAKSRLAAAEAADGPMLPASEVLFLRGFPARVDNLPARVDTEARGSVMTVSADGLVVRGVIPAFEKGLVRPGQTVRITSLADGVTMSGTVASVSESPQPENTQPENTQPKNTPAETPEPGQQPVGGVRKAERTAAGQGGSYPVVVRPNRALSLDLDSQQVRLTVQASPSRGSVLAVPTSAVLMTPDGSTAVTLVRDGKRHRVEVVPGTSGEGWTEIRPAADGEVKEGDRVVVQEPMPPPGAASTPVPAAVAVPASADRPAPTGGAGSPAAPAPPSATTRTP